MPSIPPSAILDKGVHRGDLGDVAALAASIQSVGLLSPIVVTAGNALVAGRRRLAAVQLLGWRDVPIVRVDLSDAARVLMLDSAETTCHEELSPFQAAEVRRQRAEILSSDEVAQKHKTTRRGHVRVRSAPDQSPCWLEALQISAIGTGFLPASIDKVDQIREIAELGVLRRPDREMKASEAVGHVAKEALSALKVTGSDMDECWDALVAALEADAAIGSTGPLQGSDGTSLLEAPHGSRPRLVTRRSSLLVGVAGAMGLVLADTNQLPAAAAPEPDGSRGTNVRSTGATGDGVTDDTAAVRAAIVAAAGEEVYFPAGTYVIDALRADGRTRFQLDPAATLLAKPNTTSSSMIAFIGAELTIRGGTIDGNRLKQAGRPMIIAGQVQKGKVVSVSDVRFTGTVKAALYLSEFGGFASVDNCTFNDQAEHTGELNVGLSMIASIVSGQVGSKGHFRFNYNRCIGTVTPTGPGRNPGGVFMSPASANAPLVGNMTTLEATGNYFWGYGQNWAGNTISAIHLYRSTMGVRITGNYFEECSFSAISAKSVTDFICTGNVFVGGAINSQNIASEGVISYVPGYNAGSALQPRGLITSNVIDNPGGQSASLLQNAISVHGTLASHAKDVVVANNVIKGGGVGIQVEYVEDMIIEGNVVDGSRGAAVQVHFGEDLKLSGNMIQGAGGGAGGSQSGITLTQMTGAVTVTGNVVSTQNGHGIIALASVNNSRISLIGNRFTHAAAGYFAAVVRGPAFLKITGNEFNATAGGALDVRGDAAGNKIRRLAYDLSNTVIAGTVTFVWPQIVTATGQLRAPKSPLGVVTPGEVGTTYQQTDGTNDSVMWISQSTSSSSWVKILSASTSNSATVNRLLGMAYDPASALAVPAPARAGVLSLTKMLLSSGGRVSKVVFHVSKAGTGLVTGQCWLGVYSANGALIGQTGDMATTFASAGAKTVALKAPTALQPPGSQIFVALLWNGAAGPQLRGIAGGGIPNIGISAVSEHRFATAGSGLKTMPATRPTPATTTAAPWFGVA